MLREWTEELRVEPWGTPDFEFFYSQPLKSITEKRRKELYLPEEEIKRLEDASMGNVTLFEEAEKEHP